MQHEYIASGCRKSQVKNTVCQRKLNGNMLQEEEQPVHTFLKGIRQILKKTNTKINWQNLTLQE